MAAAAAGAIGALTAYIEACRAGTHGNAPLLLMLVAHGAENGKADVVAAGAIPPLIRLLSDTSEPTRWQAAMALTCISNTEALRPDLVAAGAIPHLTAALASGSERTKLLAADALHNLA
jgi:HEAT repeat protein